MTHQQKIYIGKEVNGQQVVLRTKGTLFSEEIKIVAASSFEEAITLIRSDASSNGIIKSINFLKNPNS